jgi:hypothetical protein
MAVLIFDDNGRMIVTNAWTVEAQGRHAIRICYCSVADGAAFTSGATGISSAELPLSLEEFQKLLAERRPTIDLTAAVGLMTDGQKAPIAPGSIRREQTIEAQPSFSREQPVAGERV